MTKATHTLRLRIAMILAVAMLATAAYGPTIIRLASHGTVPVTMPALADGDDPDVNG